MLEADGEPLGILLLFGLLYQFEVFHNNKKKKIEIKKKKKSYTQKPQLVVGMTSRQRSFGAGFDQLPGQAPPGPDAGCGSRVYCILLWVPC